MGNIVAFIVLAVSIILFIYSGFKYAVSGGDPKIVNESQQQIITSVIGIMIAILANVIFHIFGGVLSPTKKITPHLISHSGGMKPPLSVGLGVLGSLVLLILVTFVISHFTKSKNTEFETISEKTTPIVEKPSAIIKEKTEEAQVIEQNYQQIYEQWEVVMQRNEELGLENKHQLTKVLKNDLEQVYQHYIHLDDVQKQKNYEKTKQALDQISKNILEIQEILTKKDQFELDKIIELIQIHTNR